MWKPMPSLALQLLMLIAHDIAGWAALYTLYTHNNDPRTPADATAGYLP